MTQPHRLNPKWTKGCQPNEIKEIESRLLENADLFLLLDEILAQMQETNTRNRQSLKSYELPAWSEFQADCNAVERTLEKVRNYLKLKEGSK